MNQDASTYRTHLSIGQMADGPSWQGHLQSFFTWQSVDAFRGHQLRAEDMLKMIFLQKVLHRFRPFGICRQRFIVHSMPSVGVRPIIITKEYWK